MATVTLAPMHPGEVLREEFMVPLNLTSYRLGKRLGIDRQRIERIIKEKASITPDTAIRLAKAFSVSAEFWMNLQARYDLLTTSERLKPQIEHIKPYQVAA